MFQRKDNVGSSRYEIPAETKLHLTDKYRSTELNSRLPSQLRNLDGAPLNCNYHSYIPFQSISFPKLLEGENVPGHLTNWHGLVCLYSP